ncbi:MAG: branched-chain-amino-acid transaminase [Candidatus Omnitrophica bacterium]|nr:branched-chain-amino-acid transaminase [Candidatus Omnitrophota bacterium]
MKIYIDGIFYDKKDAKISVLDHGLLYGDGVFEGIRAYNGLVFKLEEHIDRLFESAKSIMLTIPMTKKKLIEATILSLRENGLKNGYIRLVVTRGVGDLGLDPRKCRNATIIIIADKIALYPKTFYQKGLEVVTVATPRNLPEALNPQIKSLNYLNNILAKVSAINSGVEEAIMFSWDGHVAECTGDNIFVVKNGELCTPPVYLGILNGITRQVIIGIARKNKFPCTEKILTRHDLFIADEVFLTGTAAEVIPVIKIDSRPIGTGKPGRITRELMREFHALTKKEGVRYSVK